MVTWCPLFTAWALAASSLSAVLPEADAHPPVLGPAGFLGCPEGVLVQTVQFLNKELSHSVKCRTGTMGLTCAE